MAPEIDDLGQSSTQDKQTGEEREDGALSFVPLSEDPAGIRIIPWDHFQDSLANLSNTALITSELHTQREALAEKLESTLEIRKQYVQWIDELEALKLRLKSKDLSLENAKVSLQEKSEDVAIAKDRLLPSARSLLAASKCLAAAHTHLQDACKLLEGEAGRGRLSHLQKLLRARRRMMVSQIAALYPIVTCPTPSEKSSAPSPSLPPQKHSATVLSHNAVPVASDTTSKKESQSADKNDALTMTIGGLHVVAPLNSKPGLHSEPIDHESSATALGYVAHSLVLLAGCLDVPLRYPIRLGASRTYIQDHASISDASEAVANGVGPSSRMTVTEFPLFLEGQDLGRSAYAVFLLNKDLEQVLNYLGADSVGASHSLPNLKKLIQLVCSGLGRLHT